ncbi:MAG: hypothetical protein JXQ80_06930 [Bacteroidales bacterium]|nr:hypothetical protein [Bacteroidales bacterium]
MNGPYYINDYCRICNGTVKVNDKVLYRSHTPDPAAFYTEVYKETAINYPKFYKMDNLCKLGFLASELLLRDKQLNSRYAGDDIGLVLYNASSSLETDKNHQLSIQDRSSYFPSPSVFVYTLANIVIGEICIRNKFYGEGTFFVDEAFDAERMYRYVNLLLYESHVQCCIAGWIEQHGPNYDGILYLIEKTNADPGGIAIFEPQNLTQLYLQRN